jgi:glycosyltransferase involved in cell wall biosynthesis
MQKNMSKPLISIVISTYNHARYIDDAIQSVLNQSEKKYELIVVNSASTDNTAQVLKKYNKYPQITCVNLKKNIGISATVNYGIQLTKGEYIAFLNSDDMFLEDKIQKQIMYMESHRNVAATFTYMNFVDDRGKEYTDSTHPFFDALNHGNRNRYEWLNHFFHRMNPLCYSSAVIRRTLLEECGQYNPLLFQLYDFDYWIKVCLKHEIYILEEKLVKIRITENNGNVSAPTPVSMVRTFWELSHVLEHFLEIKDVAMFQKIFPDSNKNEKLNKALIPLYIAQLAIQKNTPPYLQFATNTIYSLLRDTSITKDVESRFGIADFIKLTGNLNLFIPDAEELHQELSKSKKQLESDLEEIHNAKFYKLWQKYNKIKKVISK